jgi:predicted nuclease of predicted toxin-antitoxin system
MTYLLDVNVPTGLTLFKGEQFHHVRLLNPEWSDRMIWEYALNNDLVIVTKDTDFFHWSMASTHAPKVLHLKVGNMRLQAFSLWLEHNWPKLEELLSQYQLVVAYPDKIEAIQ